MKNVSLHIVSYVLSYFPIFVTFNYFALGIQKRDMLAVNPLAHHTEDPGSVPFKGEICHRYAYTGTHLSHTHVRLHMKHIENGPFILIRLSIFNISLMNVLHI